MDPTRTTPPPAPAANHTGVVPRWRAWLATAIAGSAGLIAGRYGVDVLAGLVAVVSLPGFLAAGLALELRPRANGNEFSHIDERARVTRALERQPR